MSTLRDHIHAILRARNAQVADTWDRSCPSAPTAELHYYSGYFYGLLGNLRHVDTVRARQCLLGNRENADHWLRDFANVIAPLVDEYSPELFAHCSSFDRSLRGLQYLTNPQ